MTRPLLATIAATLLLIAMPVALVMRPAARAPVAAAVAATGPIVRAPAAALDRALARNLFAGGAAIPSEDAPEEADTTADTPADDAPRIVGIVGRLPDRAVVLVRRAAGGTRTLGLGESVDGWRLASIAPDAALFVRGGRRVRAELPPADQ